MARLETEGSGPSLSRMSSFGPQLSAPSMSAGGRVGAFVQTLNILNPGQPGGCLGPNPRPGTPSPGRPGGCLHPMQRLILPFDALSAGGGPRYSGVRVHARRVEQRSFMQRAPPYTLP
jgi:hypothetical protein